MVVENSKRAFCAFGIGITASICVGCGGAQPSPPTVVLPSAIARHNFANDVDARTSWVSPEASGEDLLYVAGSRSGHYVYIFTYPAGQHVGTLSGLWDPSAVCVDAAQRVWISSGTGNSSVMIKYAHGKTKRRARLADNYGDAYSCSVDPTTGNLAVANLFGASGYGSNIVVYANAQGTPTVYPVADLLYVWGCTYDASGNLFASGEVYNSGIHVAELPAGGSQFTDLNLSKSLSDTASGLKWDGAYLDLGVGTQIYQLLINGSEATVKNTVTLNDADYEWGFNFFVDGGTVITHVLPKLGAVGLWNFPSGGYPTQIIPNAHGEKEGYNQNGIAVSKALKR